MSEFRIAPGLLAVSELDDTYDITKINTAASSINNGSRPTDMGDYLDWVEPLEDRDKYQPYTSVVDSWYARHMFGGGEFTWVLGPWTTGMIAQFKADIFNDAMHAQVTVRTEDSTSGGGFIVVQARVFWPEVSKYRRAGELWFLPFDFFNAVSAPETP
jgi:hypothetical protein